MVKFPTAKFSLKKGTYFSRLLGAISPGKSVKAPLVLKKVLPKSFDVELLSESIETSLYIEGGIGDKIYFVPLVYALSERLGVELRDRPLFRAVSFKAREPKKEDLPTSIFLRQSYTENLTDQYVEALGLEPSLKMPVLETTFQEKTSVGIPKYIVVRLKASSESRRVLTSQIVDKVKELGLQVIVPETNSLPVLLPLIEKAEVVVTTSSGVLPMAIGFQVPVIGCNANQCVNRINYSVEAYARDPEASEIVDLLQDILSNRFKCWCGESKGISVIQNNLWMIECANCGTVRQDIKVSPLAFKSFLIEQSGAWLHDYVGISPIKKSFKSLISKVFSMGQVSYWLDIGSGNGSIREVFSLGVHLTTVDLDGDSDFKDISEVKGLFDVISLINVIHFIDLWKDFIFILQHLKQGGFLVVKGFVRAPTRYERFRYLFPLKEVWLKKFLIFYDLAVMYSSLEGDELTVIAKRL